MRALVTDDDGIGSVGLRTLAAVWHPELFSDMSGALTMTSASQGIILASFASEALTAVGRPEKADTLAVGLHSNREIGKAIGLMMAFHKVSDTAAFESLRQASQDMNLKISDIARPVVDHYNARPE